MFAKKYDICIHWCSHRGNTGDTFPMHPTMSLYSVVNFVDISVPHEPIFAPSDKSAG